MASTAAVTDSYKQDILNGVHQPGDTYMVALYTSSATLSKSTTAYTTSNETSGTGYTAGGVLFRIHRVYLYRHCLPDLVNQSILDRFVYHSGHGSHL